MFENPRRGRKARNFTTNAPKILGLKSSSEQIFSRKLPLGAPEVCQVSLQLLTKKCLLCLGKTKHRWLQLSLTQSQHPFSVRWEILDVGMEDGHRSWRWTATRYGVACVRLLDSRDIRASVWVFPTKSNAKIPIGWDELARSVSNKKKFNMRRFRARLKKRRFDKKCGTKWTSVGTHAETHITKIKQSKCSYSTFSSVQFIFI